LETRSITLAPPVNPRRLHDGLPVLQPDPGVHWASRVVLNPAAVMVDDDATLLKLIDRLHLDERTVRSIRARAAVTVMLFRAQGDLDPSLDHAPSRIGLALFTPELELLYRASEPVIDVGEPFHNLGVEDARCSRVGDTFYLYYTGYCQESDGRRVRICLATSENLVDWQLHGPLAGDLNDVDNKNPALFPEPVQGKWLMLHRPMEGPGAMAIHLAEADSPAGPWRSRGLLMHSFAYHEFERSWIGAGGPPVSLGGERFLAIYHQGHFTRDGRREYDLAAALFDFGLDDPVVARIEPLMRPSGPIEQAGELALGVDNVLFTCANYVLGEDLIIPYAGADSRILGASVHLQALVSALENTR
jgi:beta-1,2-mannobiose phosphorylase / 1,2-beta-oligomannan phosphorylase